MFPMIGRYEHPGIGKNSRLAEAVEETAYLRVEPEQAFVVKGHKARLDLLQLPLTFRPVVGARDVPCDNGLPTATGCGELPGGRWAGPESTRCPRRGKVRTVYVHEVEKKEKRPPRFLGVTRSWRMGVSQPRASLG